MTIAKIARRAVIAAAIGVAAMGSVAAYQSNDGLDRRVRIHNVTGWTMTHFYASDSRVDSWQEDILGRSVLPNGQSIVMNIDDGSGACMYDFKARFNNGQELTRFGVNVCQITDYHYTR